MSTQPLTVICTTCTAKFHVPDELVRGKIVKFRCRKCGGTIDVDGRVNAASPSNSPLDTPATFSQSRPPPALLPPLEPPTLRDVDGEPSFTDLGRSTWPTALPSTPPEATPPRAVPREPGTSGTKVAALVVLLVAAGLSAFGLLLRDRTPSVPVSAADLDPAAQEAPTGLDPKSAEPSGSAQVGTAKGATKVGDLPPAPENLPRASKPEVNPATPPAAQEADTAGNAVAEPAATQPTAAATGATEEATPPPLTAQAGAPSTAQAGTPPSTGMAPVAAPSPPPPAPVSGPGTARETTAGSRDREFNTQAAREALDDGMSRAASCRTVDTPPGAARVAVTFAPTGQATSASIESGVLVGTKAGACVASKFRTLRVPPFSGDAVTVHKSIRF